MTALHLFDQISLNTTVGKSHRGMLAWATKMHEIGLSLSHASYQRHSAYLVEASDMAGFSHQEQSFLAALVGYQRRNIPADYLDKLPARLHESLRTTLICMRLAWIFCRTREDEGIPGFRITLKTPTVGLALPLQWMKNHPLTVADLEDEEVILKSIGLNLEIEYCSNELS